MSEEIKETGVENGIPFVVTQEGEYPNIVCRRYEGENIPEQFREVIKPQLPLKKGGK